MAALQDNQSWEASERKKRIGKHELNLIKK